MDSERDEEEIRKHDDSVKAYEKSSLNLKKLKAEYSGERYD